ncbi:MAG: phosphatidate cytidylyltransferase [Candidatus Accumulibacter sp.]|jgi:phosphatidate cytidylyltransferase|nr:phosphatidate cytidylyltransferase [Accumulibacter sp.]
MLKARVFTAVVLLSVFVYALFGLPPLGWACFVTLLAALAAWEWGGLMAISSCMRISFGVVMSLICAVLVFAFPSSMGFDANFSGAAWGLGRYFYIPACFFWFLCVPFWMKRRWPLRKTVAGMATGMLLILPTWLALIQLKRLGAWFLLAIMAVVWLADIGGYFFGRLLGRHKLAPAISPGKTWEGVCGGVLAVVVYGFVLQAKFPESVTLQPMLLLFSLIFLALFSVVGDLFESMLKRQAGIKDSSRLLPGHGGVLDRIDSLTSVLPLVALIWLSPFGSWL